LAYLLLHGDNMKTGTGVVSIFLAGALVVSSANTRTAEARSSAFTASAATTTNTKTTTTTVATSDALTTTANGNDIAVAARGELVTPPRALENPKLRRMQKAEISAAMLQVAAQIVRQHYAKPVGTQVEVDVDGKHLYARIERHFHPEGGPVKPWGFHPGVSLFCAR